MPEMIFAGPCALHYPENKDAQGRNLSLVQPGDIRDLDGPPDHWWREATDEDRARLAAQSADVAARLAEDRLRASEEQAEQHEDAGGQEAGEPSGQHEPGQ